MTGEPNSIGQIHISVDDVDRAVAWYRDVLGLEFLFQVPGQPMAFFNCGGVRLYLGQSRRRDRSGPGPSCTTGSTKSTEPSPRSPIVVANSPTNPMSCTGTKPTNSGWPVSEIPKGIRSSSWRSALSGPSRASEVNNLWH